MMARIAIAFLIGCSLAASAFAQSVETPPTAEPFAFADFSWLNGSSRQKRSVLETPAFTGEFRADINYVYDFNHPRDHTLDGSAETGRTNEIQVQQLGIGGDFHYEHVRGRVMTQFGMYSQLTPRNDASPARGQWNLDDAYRYISEAYGGYHWDALHGVNLDAGIFMSYVGLFSYYNFDNWAYQPSYVSANTPWFFNGVRLQMFLSDRLKTEFWLVNGWQAYGMFNNTPGVGFQVLWRPNGSVSLLSNAYYGRDTPTVPERGRVHSDTSVEWKYVDRPEKGLSKAALSITGDIGCESGGGVTCATQRFAGFMVYNRLWFDRDRLGLTIGGGAIDNPGRYLVLLPPIDGATAATGSPFFSTAPGDSFSAWDGSVTFDVMPNDLITFRSEFNHRAANVPYFVGAGGLSDGAPDLRRSENRVNLALLVKF